MKKSILTQLSIVATLLGIVAPAYSASISFLPIGQQLDSDPINDLGVSVNDQFTFTLQIDTTGLSDNLSSFTYRVTRDNSEILLDFAGLTAQGASFFPNRTVISDIPSGNSTIGLINLDSGTQPGLPPNILLDYGTATYTVQSGLINDGLSDYQLELIEAFDSQGNNITSQFSQTSQELDVQSTPESTSIMSFLFLSTIGAAAAFKSKRKLNV